MRSMNKVQLTNNHSLEIPGTAVILGPGSTWSRVLEIVSPDKYTVIHGQCLGVGVGGFLLGGGINAIGTSQRYRSGASNVLQYTMVDAMGDIYKVFSLIIVIITLPEFRNYMYRIGFRKFAFIFIFRCLLRSQKVT